MRRRVLVLAAVAAVLVSGCTVGRMSTTHQIVQDATDTVEALKAQPYTPKFTEMLRNAHGVAIFPDLYKGAFLLGAEGGDGVVLARDASGQWSYPAFYSIASGSIGLQIGGQKSRTALILRTPGALQAFIENQGKIGADMGLAVATVGTGVEGAVTTNLGADIIAFSDAVGLYGGVSLEGSALVRRNDFNQDYYYVPSTPQDILIERQRTNPQADPLRNALATP